MLLGLLSAAFIGGGLIEDQKLVGCVDATINEAHYADITTQSEV